MNGRAIARGFLPVALFAVLACAPLFSASRAAAQEEEEEQAQAAQPQPQPRLAPIPRLRLGGPLGAQMPVEAAAPRTDEPLTDEEADEAVQDAVGGELGADSLDDEGWDDDEAWEEQGWDDPFAEDGSGEGAEGAEPTGAALGAAGETEAAEGEAEHEGAHAPGAAHGEHGEEHHAASITDTNFIASIVNFILWAVIVVVLFRKPLTAMLVGRRREVEEGLEEAGRLKDEAEAKFADYSERLERLDEELEKLRKEMIQAGESERDRIIGEAEARAARMRRDAQFVIDQQLKQLKADLTREAVEAAINAAEKALVEQIGGADQQRLADDYLSNVSETIKDEEVRA